MMPISTSLFATCRGFLLPDGLISSRNFPRTNTNVSLRAKNPIIDRHGK